MSSQKYKMSEMSLINDIFVKYIYPTNLHPDIDIKFISNSCFSTLHKDLFLPIIGKLNDQLFQKSHTMHLFKKSFNLVLYNLISNAIGLPIINLRQNHEKKVLEITSETIKDWDILGSESNSENYDAGFTSEKDVYLSSIVADCIVCIAYSPISKKIINIHSSRVLTEQNFVTYSMQKAFEKKEMQDIFVYFGPSIHFSKYELQQIDLDRKHDFYTKNSNHISKINGKIFFDNVGCAIQSLKEIGIQGENIDTSCNVDTYSSDMFPSYRRSTHNEDAFEQLARFIGICKINNTNNISFHNVL